MRPKLRTRDFEDVRVRHDDLLAGDAAQPGALDADVLDGALKVIHAEEVADDERFVQRDRQRSQQVAEHRLHGERDGDAADTQAGQQRLDLHAQIVERQQQHHRPDGQARRRTE